MLLLIADPAAFYEAAPDAIKRMLLQEVFEKVWIIDEQVVGVDLTRPFPEALTVEAQLVDARHRQAQTRRLSPTRGARR